MYINKLKSENKYDENLVKSFVQSLPKEFYAFNSFVNDLFEPDASKYIDSVNNTL